MSKFKGSGDISRTIILGMLAEGQKHGYEIKKRIRQALGEAADINFGSIYYGLKTLTGNGFVDHIRDEPGKGSPERSIYRITPKGRRELVKLLQRSLQQPDSPLHAVEIGLHFMDILPAGKVREILAERYSKLKQIYESALVEEAPPDEPSWASYIREYRLYQLGAEVHWLKNLLPKLKKG